MFVKVHLVASFLFLPRGFYNGGYVFSFIALSFVIVITMCCYFSVSEASDKFKTYSLSRIGKKAFGKCGKYMVEIIIAVTQVIIVNIYEFRYHFL